MQLLSVFSHPLVVTASELSIFAVVTHIIYYVTCFDIKMSAYTYCLVIVFLKTAERIYTQTAVPLGESSTER